MPLDTGAVDLTSPSHIGVMVKDVDKTIEFLSSVCGIGPWESAELSLDKDKLMMGEPCGLKEAHARLGSMLLELLQPAGGRSVWSEVLETKGEGIHHIAFDVPNWDEVVSKLQAQGGKMVAGGFLGKKRWCYIDTKPGGIIVEVADIGLHGDTAKKLGL